MLACLYCTSASAQTHWTAIPAGTHHNLWGLCQGGGQFVAVGEGGTILTSPDGLAWTPRRSGTDAWLTSVAFGLGQYLAVGSDGTILYSRDAISWENVAARETTTTTDRLNVVTFTNGRFLAYGEHGRAITIALPVRLDGHERPTKPAAPWWRGFAYARERFVLGGETGIAVFRSNDPFMTGALSINVPPIARNVSAVVFDHGRFTAVGSAGAVLTSSDASTWSLDISATSADLHGITTFNNTLVAVGGQGTILVQSEPGTWQRAIVPSSELLLAVAASDNAAIVVGGNGTVLRATPAPFTPRIVSAPTAVTETLGGATSFAVEARGSLPLTYQWHRNGVALPGETRSALTRTPLASADGGTYTVRITNSAGSVTSSGATLTLLPAPAAVVDETFRADASLDGTVNALLPLPDGSILVATRQEMRGDATLCRVRKLKPDGSLDPGWASNTLDAVAPNLPTVTQFVLYPDGTVLVAGAFETHNGQPRPNLVRLKPDGTLDTGFVAATEATIAPPLSLVLQPDGKILVANNRTTPLRLFANGALDPGFRPAPQARVPIPNLPGALTDRLIKNVAVTSDGKVYTGGVANLQITLIQGPVPDTRIERLNADGSVDASFTALQWRAGLSTMSVLQDDSLLVVRQVSASADDRFYMTEGRAMRFRPDGSEFPLYAAPRIGSSSVRHVYPDGRFLYGTGTAGLVRLTALGAVDPTFTSGIGSASAVGVAPNGQVLVGGSFTLYNGKPANRVARLNNVPNESVNAPQILGISVDQTSVGIGHPVTLRAAVTGSAEMTYVWQGVPSGPPAAATNSPTLTLAFTTPGEHSVQLTAQNPRGTARSDPITFYVAPAPPVITAQPTRISAQLGREVTLSVSINSATAGSCICDWYRDGQPLTTSSRYDLHWASWYLPNVTAADAGTYTVVVRNAAGVTVTSAPIVLTIDDSSRFINLSTRATLTTADQPIIAGFVITGDRARTVLVRGIGPALAKFGVAGVLADPQIMLFDSSGRPQPHNANDDWTDTSLATTFARLGAFPLEAGSKDAAVVASLSPGAYTVQLTAKAGQSGLALVEIYEADNIADRMLNISTRAFVAANSPAISGFSIYGPVPKRVLIRAAGPALVAFGVANALATPRLELRSSTGASLLGNSGWSGSALAEAFTATGAFPFPAGSRDAALLVTLAPGNYTAVIEAPAGTSGVVLAEIYEVP